MAEGNLKGVVTMDEQVLDGHKVIYKFKVDRLHLKIRTFDPLEYNTQCRKIPTSWEIELDYEPVEEVYDYYTFSIKLRRKDSSNHRVKASLDVSFYDVHNTHAFHPISSSKDRMVHDDELQGTSDDILPAMLGEVAAVVVGITIEKCHAGFDWKCASKANTDQNSINLSKL